jgi:hypothetical protein
MLVLIHAEMALAILETLLNRPAHGGRLAQLIKGDSCRGIGKGILDFPVCRTAYKQPEWIPIGETVSGRIDPHAGDIGTDRSFCPFGKNYF